MDRAGKRMLRACRERRGSARRERPRPASSAPALRSTPPGVARRRRTSSRRPAASSRGPGRPRTVCRARLDHADGRPPLAERRGPARRDAGQRASSPPPGDTLVEVARALNALHRARSAMQLGIRNWQPTRGVRPHRPSVQPPRRRRSNEGWDGRRSTASTVAHRRRLVRRSLPPRLPRGPARLTSRSPRRSTGPISRRGASSMGSSTRPTSTAMRTRSPTNVVAPRRNRREGADAPCGCSEIGADGRNIYTKDPDARGGPPLRDRQPRRPGEDVGYELHLAVQARDAGWSDGIERAEPRTRRPARDHDGLARPRRARVATMLSSRS